MATPKKLTSLEGTAFTANSVDLLVAGDGITIDKSNPDAPVISASGGGGGGSPAGATGDIQMNGEGEFAITGLSIAQAPFGPPYDDLVTLVENVKDVTLYGTGSGSTAGQAIASVAAGPGNPLDPTATKASLGAVYTPGTGSSIQLEAVLSSEGAVQIGGSVSATARTVRIALYGPESAEEGRIDLSENEISLTAITRNRQLPSLTVAELPTPSIAEGSSTLGAIAFANDGRKEGETAGNGTGVPVWSDGVSWLTFYDNTAVEA